MSMVITLIRHKLPDSNFLPLWSMHILLQSVGRTALIVNQYCIVIMVGLICFTVILLVFCSRFALCCAVGKR